MKPGSSKSNKYGPSIIDMFSKQFAKRKQENFDVTNEQLQDNKVDENTLVISEANKENHNLQAKEECFDEHLNKRIKTENDKVVPKFQVTKTNTFPKKCEYCRQKLNDEMKLYPGHPNGAVEEEIALIDPKLCLFSGSESFIHESDQLPQNKLTYFSVYDKNGHLCSFDTGLIEKNVKLYFSGYMKAIYEEDTSPDGGVPAKDIGPINEWFVSGFDGGEMALVGFSTAFAEYILMEPSDAYIPFFDLIKGKIYMSKLVIEFLLDEISPTYEDLLNKLQTIVPPKGIAKFTEDSLLRHAQFICDQVLSFDNSADSDEVPLITNPCMRALASLAGVTLGKRLAIRRTRQEQKIKKPTWTKATTTRLVNDMFENIFADQLIKHDDKIKMGPKRQRCGVCENCQQPDCGFCNACKDMIKYGGTGRSKQACIRRRCPNMTIQEADDSDPENEERYETLIENKKIEIKENWKKVFQELKKDITWVKDQITVDNQKIFYKSVIVNNEEIQVNDYVLVASRYSATPSHVAKVIYMWETKSGMKQFHANWFHRGNDTILGETSDPKELFLSDDCDDVPITCISSKCTVIFKKIPDNWADLGNMESSFEDEINDIDHKTFFYQKRYIPETARFEDPPSDLKCVKKENSYRFCPTCARLRAWEQFNTPKVFERIEEKSSKEVIYRIVKYKGEEYSVGTTVFLQPEVFKFKYETTHQDVFSLKKKNVDEDMYPEFYRKSSDHIKGSNLDTPKPFCIGYINLIYANTDDMLVSPSDINIKVNKLYRPENTHREPTLMEQSDLNMVYWSDEICRVKFMDVVGKCYLVYSENLCQSVDEWTVAGPNRFYFNEAYNEQEKTFYEPPDCAISIGKCGKGKHNSKLKSKNAEETKRKALINNPIEHKTLSRKLKTLDVFAGCGGLSEGFHRAGISENCWAIEKEEPAANAYRLNNSNATVFTEDCNILLKKVMDGEITNEFGQKLPQKGQVEMLCGGPPCQGFSGMNRFNSRQYSLFKSSLIVSYLSYCDFYRPKFFVMENVRNFVSFKKSMVLKLTLRCLIRMGYQCTFGILQAGNYGIPQTRRRMILLAAAPGQQLPKYPEPTHVFSKRVCQLSVLVDNRKYNSNCTWTESAPFRTINVKDAMSDLPEIKNGWSKDEMPYNSEPMSHFQRNVRKKQYQLLLRDHVCKEMAPLVEARMAHIPIAPGSDWRDLPNIAIRLSDGTYCNKLEYIYDDKKAGRSSTGAYRGVCSCCTGKSCDSTDRQFNTLIPWCLPHTGNRHNHWAGLYGRVEWNGFFGTTITNPEPMGKQGRVLHPVQTRVVSVRECARSQGFSDSFRFYGTILDKHRQIGNAVPPPLAAAIGYEIRKCIQSENITTETDRDVESKINCLISTRDDTILSENI
ncbi:DNA (cytosine-5)-methyltransferase PliMCI-like [Colletes gigas]|uniref:DNA (cytosine-5)-methyltransferase PliMCI-like n=1 Tax=Colletes gigas TaxID=935657 RepID=UPI001C9B04AD|nr:DNA (cytosine-5)-methyltransferase PliMCI-like [Colletes gigas]